jgi:nitrate/TMAO reductase-like tetraheme cytochrome c subunit
VPLIAGFRNPETRPRYILWSGAVLIGFAAFMIAALGITSTRWFCSEGCHKVQDDTILAYEHSTHSEVSCMACHMPAGATPIEFIFHKSEALGELYLTVTDQFELPLNAESHVARTMPSEQCTQCHDMEKREATPSEGVIIDHAIHEENGVACAICHNRVAHNEDFQLTLKSPDGEPNQKHEVYGSMTACFRCHTQGLPVSGPKAPGDCYACHPKDMQLKPESHLAEGFFPAGHGDLGKAEAVRVAGVTGESTVSAAVEGEGEGELVQAAEESEEPAEGGHGEAGGVGESLGRVDSINECYTCHAEKFCTDCHGLPMPHEGGFAGSHAKLGTENPKQCEMCHGPSGTSCDSCHHGTSIEHELDTSVPWLNQHMVAVRDVGTAKCIEECHNPTYCARCHVRGSAE